MKYYQCFKCGSIITINDNETISSICCNSMPIRTSGICGGGFNEISENEYIKKMQK